MAIDPQNTDAVAITQLDPLTPLSIATYLVGCNADGKMGNFTAEQLAVIIAPYVSAIGSSPFVENTGSPLPNPIEKPTAITFVGIGDFDQTTGANIVTTEELNVLFWSSNGATGTWVIGVEIPIDLTNYVQKELLPSNNQLFDNSTTSSGIMNANGTTSVDVARFYSDYIKVLPNTTYRFRSEIGNVGAVKFAAYNASKVVQPSEGSDTTTSTILTGPNTHYVIVTGYPPNLSDYMFNEGSTPLPYEEYELAYYIDPNVLVSEFSIPDIFRKKSVLITDADLAEVYRKENVLINTDDTSFIEFVPSPNLFDKDVPSENFGHYLLNTNGTIQNNAAYFYSKKFAVTPNTPYRIFSATSGVGARYITAYNASNVVQATEGLGALNTAYTSGPNTHFIVVSHLITGIDDLMIVEGTVIEPYIPFGGYNVLDDEIQVPTITDELREDILLDAYNQQILIQSITGQPANRSSIASLTTGNTLTVSGFPYHLKKGLAMSFYADISSFAGSIDFGKGIGMYRGDWLTIDSTNIYWKHYETSVETKATIAHGLTLSTFIKCSIYVDDQSVCNVILQTLTDYFQTTFDWTFEANYAPFIKTTGQTLSNVKIDCASKEFQHPVWAFGDSYFGVAANRWVGVMKDFGFFNFLIDGLAGQGSAAAYTDLNRCLTYGTPKYLLWFLGMNDTDAVYQTNLDLVISICQAKKITLILGIVPTVPTRSKEVIKSAIIASGYRYVDFYKAVGANSSGVWYTGYLESITPAVHPTDLGAQALATQVLVDFPEIMQYGVINPGSGTT